MIVANNEKPITATQFGGSCAVLAKLAELYKGEAFHLVEWSIDDDNRFDSRFIQKWLGDNLRAYVYSNPINVMSLAGQDLINERAIEKLQT